ncbi:MAG: urease accessory protein, partial [Halothiobacillaceae bacterium]
MNTPLNNIALLRLMQLVSPALPVGAYAYSQGLEYAVEARWVTNAAQVQSWLLGLLQHNVVRVDLPLLKRLYGAWQRGDQEEVEYWNRYLCACRESAELQHEDHHLGRALAKLLASLEVEGAAPWQQHATPTFATLFALAAVRWSIPLEQSAMGYL